MKKYLLSLILILSQVFYIQAFTESAARSYIERYKEAALNNERAYGIPAPIILAQGILESDAGKSRLTRSSNNHFGIKQGSEWKGRIFRAFDDEGDVKSKFRVYDSAEESYRDHALLLSRASRYRPLFSHSIYDYRAWAHGLKRAGYATAPKYAEALIGIIEHYRLYNINGGAKMRPGKTVVITRYVTVETPVETLDEEIEIEEESEIEKNGQMSAEEENYLRLTQRFVVSINDLHCTIVQPGEDIYTLARRYDISPKDLMKFNDVDSPDQIEEGDIIFLEKKKDKFEGTQDIYPAKGNETLRQISQEFGIKVDRLAALNNISRYTPIEKGMQIYVK